MSTELDNWIAGYLSARGSLTITSGRNAPQVRLILRSVDDEESLARIARWCGNKVRRTNLNGKSGYQVQLQGEKLHSHMRRIWELLTETRKREYAALRHEAAKQAAKRPGRALGIQTDGWERAKAAGKRTGLGRGPYSQP